MISAAATGHDVALSAFIDEDGHHVVALFAFLWPSSVEPASVIALMIVAQVSCDPLNPLRQVLLTDDTGSLPLSADPTASLDLGSTLDEAVLVPVVAMARLPLGTTDIAEFEFTPAPVLDDKLHSTPRCHRDPRHMVATRFQLDHAPAVLAPLPALLSS